MTKMHPLHKLIGTEVMVCHCTEPFNGGRIVSQSCYSIFYMCHALFFWAHTLRIGVQVDLVVTENVKIVLSLITRRYYSWSPTPVLTTSSLSKSVVLNEYPRATWECRPLLACYIAAIILPHLKHTYKNTHVSTDIYILNIIKCLFYIYWEFF